MEFHFEQGEILQVNKPYTWTSFDVVGKVRSMIRKATKLRKIKIGHAGTLDPLASGLLILCTGKFTKRIEEFQALEKEYTGTFRLGATTPSFDLETEVDNVFEGDLPDEEKIHAATPLFTGELDQVPPQFSAIKVDGKRAYNSARRDIPVEITPRKITIYAFEITKIDLPDVNFRVACSKGTYIRSLARDFGNHLGCGAHLTALCRTRIGHYHLRDAYEIEELEKMIRFEDGANEGLVKP
jgi:tRNA pseudouridine55 synthase